MKKTIITVGREFGSGGHEIGQKLADELGFAFYDAELLAKTAEDSRLSDKIIAQYDEVPASAFLQFGIGTASPEYNTPFSIRVLIAQFEAIRAIAENEEAVIVGRCADYVLNEHPSLFSVFVTADKETRINRIMQRCEITREAAQTLLAKKDKRRAAYYNYYTDKKWGAAQSYDLCLSSSLFGIDGTVGLIKQAIMKAE